MPQTVAEKICQAHLAEGPDRPLRAGDFVSLRPHHIMTHDNTSAVISKFKGLGAKKVHDPRQPVFALDHDIQNTAEDNLKKYRTIEAFAKEHGIDFHPAGTGIGHQIMVEHGYVVPGSLCVASDSHSNTYGALGALGTPVVRTDAACVWATGEFWWQIPPTVQVVLEGRLRPGVTGKDLIITLCGLYNKEEVLNVIVEFAGPGVAGLSMDERFAISNMTTEWGALAGWFPCDATTIAYLRQRLDVMLRRGVGRYTDEDLAAWTTSPPAPDPDAAYAARITVDLSAITPHVSGPDSVQVMQPVADLEAKGVAIHKAYLLSCTNARLSDFEAAARVVKGKRVAPGVKFYIAAASREIEDAAKASGAWGTLVEAGAIELPPSCGPCIGLGTGLLEAGEVGISATNRNFKGRMGSRDAKCYLGSPAVVAASAVAGRIAAPAAAPAAASAASPGAPAGAPLAKRIEVFTLPAPPAETVEIVPGFPRAVTGRLLFLPQDNLNTDGIYGKDYTYREDMTREKMAEVVMENYDPAFAATAAAGDVVAAGFNFGTGSSREQAVTALQAKGIPLVIAGSFSQTYLRNAFNNGFLCIECPELVNRLKARHAGAPGKTIVAAEKVDIDFATGTATLAGETFRFPPPGSVPQSLVAAGGVEKLVSKKLAASN